jgi:hypothetical protein
VPNAAASSNGALVLAWRFRAHLALPEKGLFKVAHAVLRDIAIDRYAGRVTGEPSFGLGQKSKSSKWGKRFVPCADSDVTQAVV